MQYVDDLYRLHYCGTMRTTIVLVLFPDPDPHAGKGSLGFADSTVQDPGLPIRFKACDFSCDIGQRNRDIDRNH